MEKRKERGEEKEAVNVPRVPMGGREIEREKTDLGTNSAWLAVHAWGAGRSFGARVALLSSFSLITRGSGCTCEHDDKRPGGSEKRIDDIKRLECGPRPQLRADQRCSIEDVHELR